MPCVHSDMARSGWLIRPAGAVDRQPEDAACHVPHGQQDAVDGVVRVAERGPREHQAGGEQDPERERRHAGGMHGRGPRERYRAPGRSFRMASFASHVIVKGCSSGAAFSGNLYHVWKIQPSGRPPAARSLGSHSTELPSGIA